MRTFLLPLVFLLLGLGQAQAAEALRLDTLIKGELSAGKKSIAVPPGSYTVHGSIILSDLKDLEIVAAPGVTVVASQNEPVFVVTRSSGVLIKGFAIHSRDPRRPESPIAFGFSSGRYVESAEHKTTTAIKIFDTERVTVADLSVKGFYRGIYITSARTPTREVTVRNCTVSDCGYFSIAASKVLKGGQEHPLTNIRFLDNEVRGSEMGPIFIGVKNGTMSGNKVLKNIIGIRIEQSDHNLISGNTVSQNLKMGIWVYNHSSYNTITRNLITDNNLQAERIKKIARKHGMDENYLPGDLVCSDVPREITKAYGPAARSNPVLAEEPDFWPYPTAYEHITPGSKFGRQSAEDYKKFWGIYFCQWSGVGIELRHAASHNQITENRIYNTAPASPATGYMTYGIRISQLGLMKDTELYASRGNVIRNNQIRNMVKGEILDDNKRFNPKIKNEY